MISIVQTCVAADFLWLFQDTLDAVENLLKKHEAFEKSAATQEERFAALEKPTTVSDLSLVSLVLVELLTKEQLNFFKRTDNLQ